MDRLDRIIDLLEALEGLHPVDMPEFRRMIEPLFTAAELSQIDLRMAIVRHSYERRAN